jgi:putative Holliday junction resolvase
MPEPLTLLGFDYGLKRIGVASGQTLTHTTQAVGLVHCRDGAPDWPHIQRLFDQWKPDALVVGMPYTTDGSAHALTPRVERFARQLQGRFHVPVHLIDERLSSHEATARQRDEGSRRSLDEHAAQIILETWLNSART